MTDKATEKQMKKVLLDVLRHAPDSIGVDLDAEGFLPIEEFLYSVNLFRALEHTEECLLSVLEADTTLFEREGDKIRAVEGHTTDQFEYPLVEPPKTLYYLTKPKEAGRVRSHGLEAITKKWIPLELTEEGAEDTKGRRRIKKPIVVTISAKDAWDNGDSFYFFCNRWYVQGVDPAFCNLSE